MSATDSESKESERFHFFRHRLRLRRLRSSENQIVGVGSEQKDKPITTHVPMLCD